MQTSREWPGAVLEVLESTDSTMEDALALARKGAPSGSAVMTGFQAKGRGRVPGRTWVSPPWESLLVTIILRAADVAFPVAELPLRAGVAAALGVEEAGGIAVQIKWPNDLVFGGRKLAGLLCMASGGVMLVGLGVNLLQQRFPEDLAMPAVSLVQACGRRVEPRALLPAVLSSLARVAADASWREALIERLYARGRTVTVDLIGSARSMEGVLRTVDERGRLILGMPDGSLRAVEQGEIRPGR